MKLHLSLFLVCCSYSLQAHPKFASELGSGQTKITKISPNKAFAYNPSQLAWNLNSHYTPIFLEQRFSKEIPYIARKAFRFEEQENEVKVNQIESLLNKGLHMNTALGSVYVRKNFGLALLASSDFDAIARASVAPLLEMETTEQVTLFISYAYALSEHFSLGISLKPTYKIVHHAEKNAVQILDNGQVLNPFKHGKSRSECGVDVGASERWNLSSEDSIDSAVVFENLDQRDHKIFKIGSAYEKRFPFLLNRMQVMYAYVYEWNPIASKLSPHRLGMELEAWGRLIFAVGAYKGKATCGMTLRYDHFEVSYANYYEPSPHIHRLTPDRMQALGFHLLF